MSKSDRREVMEGVDYSFPQMRDIDRLTGWKKFKLTLYNPEKKTFLGRTRKSWAQVSLFYLIFFTVLAGVFSVCMKTIMSTIDPIMPKWILEESLIGTNPGVGFRPLPARTEEGSMIWYDAKNITQTNKWVGLINNFLELYLTREKLPGKGHNQVKCDFGRPPPNGKVCAVDVSSWHPCTPKENYSYPNATPCLFVKINKIYGWMPECYDDPNDLPDDMPAYLKEYISAQPAHMRKQVWISCSGENPIDKELLGNNGIKYIPPPGIPEYYFPYVNTKGYLSPLVAVQILNPPMNRIVNVECRAWAKNIKYHGGFRNREGSVHFEMMID